MDARLASFLKVIAFTFAALLLAAILVQLTGGPASPANATPSVAPNASADASL